MAVSALDFIPRHILFKSMLFTHADDMIAKKRKKMPTEVFRYIEYTFKSVQTREKGNILIFGKRKYKKQHITPAAIATSRKEY